jgi:hypothetical protein
MGIADDTACDLQHRRAKCTIGWEFIPANREAPVDRLLSRIPLQPPSRGLKILIQIAIPF